MHTLLVCAALFSIVDAYTFGITKNAYNGTITFNGLVKACQKDFKNGKPCTTLQMSEGIWNYKIPSSWILNFDTNCLGYSTDSKEAYGLMYSTNLGYLEWITCETYAAVCCFY